MVVYSLSLQATMYDTTITYISSSTFDPIKSIANKRPASVKTLFWGVSKVWKLLPVKLAMIVHTRPLSLVYYHP